MKASIHVKNPNIPPEEEPIGGRNKWIKIVEELFEEFNDQCAVERKRIETDKNHTRSQRERKEREMQKKIDANNASEKLPDALRNAYYATYRPAEG